MESFKKDMKERMMNHVVRRRDWRWWVTVVPGVLLLNLLLMAPWCRAQAGTPQADLLIKRGDDPDEAFAINDVYQTGGAFGDQHVVQIVPTGKTATYLVKVENDGTETSAFSLWATEYYTPGWTVTYTVGSADITKDISICENSPCGYTTATLAPGGSEIITIRMTPPGTATFGDIDTTMISVQPPIDPDRPFASRPALDQVRAWTTVAGPDLLIKRGDESDSAYAINDEYQTTPSGDQIETQTVAAGKTATYQVKVENDTNVTTSFGINAYGKSWYGWTVTYKVGFTDITNDITSFGDTTSTLAPGGSEIITIEVTPSGSVASGDSKSVIIEAVLRSSITVDTVLDTVEAVTTMTTKPDLLIKRGDETDSAFAINDEYQTTPSGDQIETQTVAAGKTATYQVKVENDGTEARTFKLRASEGIGAGWKVTYKVGSTNITADITGSGYTTPTLESGGSKIITIEMKSPGSSAYAASKSTTIEAYLSASDTTVRDAVQAITKVSSGVSPSPTPTATHTPVPTPPPSDYLKYTKGSSRKYGEKVKVGDPISASNGAYQFTMPLISLGGPMDLRFELFYRSDFDQNLSDAKVPNPFWWYPYTTASVGEIVTVDGVDKTLATIQLPNGDLVSFKKDSSGNWTLVDPDEDVGFTQYYNNGSSIKYVLKETTEYVYLMDPAQEMMYIFQKLPAVSSTAARIVRIMDRNDNTVTYSYSTDTDQNPSRIEDGLGRSLDLTYGDVGGETFLQTVTDHGGRKIQFTYEAQGTDNASLPTLRSVTDVMNQVTTFRYAGSSSEHHIISKELPRGNTPFTQTYESVTLNGDTSLRVVSQKDAQDNTTTLAYDSNANVVTETQPDSNTRKYKHFSQYSLPEKLTDAANNEAKMEKNSSEQLIGVTDRLGDTTSFTYHDETGKLSSITNAKGGKFTYTYTAQSQTITNPINSEQVDFTFYNLTRTDYPDNTSEQFTYDASGNAITRVDQAGKTWTSTYNSRGQILTITNPEGGVTTYTYNTDAMLASLTDSDTGATTYTYDTLMRPTTITRPDGSAFQLAYDANNRNTSAVDERGNTTSYTYDANGNQTSITDPTGNITQYTHDALDRVTQYTDRLGKTITYAYDSLARLSSVKDPTNVATTFGYDSRGWMNKVTRDVHTWQAGYDNEGMTASRSTPQGSAITTQRDNLGYLTGITDPLSNTTTLTRDAMSRTASVTDPLGRTTTFTYDGLGLLTGVNMPAIGTATYQRNGIGVLTGMTDLNGQDWAFTTSPMGRLTAEVDPVGNTWQYTYDTEGRPSLATFPDGGTMTSAYDAASNLTRQLFSDGTDLQFTYDSLDRLATANNIALTYDAEGNVTNTEDTGHSFGAAYDDAGRLKTVTYNPALSGVEGNGTFTVTYTYDNSTGFLTGVEDSLTGAEVIFTYDDDLRLSGITRSNGVNATLTWDNAARLTRIQDGPSTGSGFLDLQYTIDAAWQITKYSMTAPLDPIDFLSNSASNFTYDAASQVSTSGYTYDKRGRLTASPDHTFRWDGASRLVGIDDVTLTYNGLGDLMTRTQEGSTIHFYYNHAIGLSPIVAEQNEDTGQFLRYYVWTPDGQLLYMIDAANGNKVYFYHFDRTGSTLAITDATGTVTDSYAYDPYGQLLSHQGSNTQPFTFVGRWGVRQEDTNGALYHMCARYYDAVSQRFLSREPVWQLVGDPRDTNPYQYASAEPVTRVDVTGATGTSDNAFWQNLNANFQSQEAKKDIKRAEKFVERQSRYFTNKDLLKVKSNNVYKTLQFQRYGRGKDAIARLIIHHQKGATLLWIGNWAAAKNVAKVGGSLLGGLAAADLLWEGVGRAIDINKINRIIAEAEEERALRKAPFDVWLVWFKMKRWEEAWREEAEEQLKEKRRKLEGLGLSRREMGRKMMRWIIDQYGWKWDRGKRKGVKMFTTEEEEELMSAILPDSPQELDAYLLETIFLMSIAD